MDRKITPFHFVFVSQKFQIWYFLLHLAERFYQLTYLSAVSQFEAMHKNLKKKVQIRNQVTFFGFYQFLKEPIKIF